MVGVIIAILGALAAFAGMSFARRYANRAEEAANRAESAVEWIRERLGVIDDGARVPEAELRPGGELL